MPSRYLIGIDLGTTNSVVAYIDTQAADANIRVFPVPQLVAHGEVRTLPALPSFLYFPTEEELSAGTVSATWDEDPPMVTGVLARDQGALVPSRQVSSAKSWLSYPGVDRRAKILPAQAEPPQPMISPVEASARYLMHLRDAWNGALGNSPDTRFERQDIVLTVPASFDEEARELTVEAARRAGLESVTLLEEPLAAFYAWIANNQCGTQPVLSEAKDALACASPGETSSSDLRDGELILICDIGGGTSDFSLVRARSQSTVDKLQFQANLYQGTASAVPPEATAEAALAAEVASALDRQPSTVDDLQFERTAIGEHLLLGGDNLDLALARHVEEKLKDVKLSLRQRYALRLACSAAKERLLSDSSLDRLPVTILGGGRAVVGQALTVDLTRDEVLRILTSGFLPITSPDDMPARGRPTGLRELGLPYVADPAITKHLAAFLTQATGVSHAPSRVLARPDAVLFNGGFCAPAVTRERIMDAISAWFDEAQAGWRPKLLDNPAVESAVARGAAYYSRVRRGAGLRIRAGSARTYYVGLRSEDGLQGTCVLPAGVDEGTTLPLLNREFSVLANRPVSFTLYSSRLRHDAHGALVTLDEASFHRHAPLVTLLRYGRKMRDAQLTVRLRASFTEVGTLELWCESRDTPHRWRLQFELRGEQALDTAPPAVSAPEGGLKAEGGPLKPAFGLSGEQVESAAHLIRRVFTNDEGGPLKPGGGPLKPAFGLSGEEELAPDNLVTRMESALGAKRDSWPITAVRGIADLLIEASAGRAQSPRHEVRWLNLAGFCLRPGFGAPGDDARVNHVQRIASALMFAEDLPSQVETLVLARRIAGGINASHQQALYRTHAPLLDIGARGRKRPRVNRQLEYDAWRLLASLEHLPAHTRTALGRELLAKIQSEPEDAIWLWSLGRLGARIPLYGPLHSVVAPEAAGEWLKLLLDLPTFTGPTASAIVMIARRTDDRSRDLDDTIREHAISLLTARGVAAETIQLLSQYVPPERADAVRSFGEFLPPGLQLVSSANCLLSPPALQSVGPTVSRPA